MINTTDSLWYSYCGSKSIWDNQISWTTEQPRLTLCFRKTILVWLPAIYLTILLPILIRTLKLMPQSSYGKQIQFKWNNYNSIRMALAIALLMFCIIDLLLTINDYNHPTLANQKFTADIINAVIRLLFSIILFTLFWSMVKRNVHTSAIIWSYLGIQSLSLLLEFISIIMDRYRHQQQSFWHLDSTMVDTIILLINYLLTFSLFIQSFISDPEAKKTIEETTKIDIEQEKPLAKMTASFFSRLTFSWYSPLTYLGLKRPIILSDIWRIRRCDSSFYNYQLFQNKLEEFRQKHDDDMKKLHGNNPNVYNNETKRFKVNIIKVIWSTLKYYFIPGSLAKVFNDIFVFANPMVLKQLINFMNDDQQPLWHGYFFALLLFLVTSGQIFALNYYFNRMMLFGLRVRTQLIAAIYRKSLQLSNSSRSKFTTGQIVNLMAVDAQRSIDISAFINLLWSAPLQIIVALVLLWRELGVSVLGGFFFMIILIPINIYVTNISKRLQIKQMKLKDERVKAMNEILNGMKIIKLYSWERAFIQRIETIRSKELQNLKRINYISAFIQALLNLAPFLVSFITFAIYVCIDQQNRLTASKAFVSLSLFNILRFPLAMLPNLISLIIMTSVSVKRLNNFFSSTKLSIYIVRNEQTNNNGNDYCMILDNCSFSWFDRYEQANNSNNDDDKDNDKNVGQNKKKNQQNIKNNNNNNKKQKHDCEKNDQPYQQQQQQQQQQSKSFLREIQMKIKPKSFVAIVGAVGSGKSSLLQAILGNMELTNGTINIVKSKRIAYTSQEPWIQNNTVRDNILFNQPFNEQMYWNVIEACSLKHDLQVLPDGDQTEIGEKGINLSGGQKQRVSLARACYNDADIYLLDDPLSAVDSHVGKHIYEHVISSTTGLLRNKTRILVTNNLWLLPETDHIYVLRDGHIIESGSYQELMKNDNYFSNLIQQFSNNNANGDDDADYGQTISDVDKKQKKTRYYSLNDQNVNIDNGDRKKSTMTTTISITWGIIILINYGLVQLSNAGSGVWLSVWSAESEQNDDMEHSDTMYYLTIYGAIGLCQGLFSGLGWIALTKGIIKAATSLHNQMLYTIFRSMMSFFDVTPLGRILNRFSKDIDRLYISTARQLKRIESITKSPVYSHFSETLSGVGTIRAYSCMEQFITKNDDNSDINNSCNLAMFISNRWLSIRLEFIANFMVFFAAVFSIIYRQKMDSSSVGLILTYALNTIQNLNYLVRSTTDIETNIVSAERILEYTDLSVEADWDIDETAPPSDWPQKGRIEFIEYGTRYRPQLDLVLKKISAIIESGEKIGIVGRTGAGKSSLTLALFRLIEAANGCIRIDGIDISKIGLHQLRNRLTIIPQDPVLFSGTLRTNLDPFTSFTDDQIWHCLELAHLKQFAQSLDGHLEYEITESGSNLSVGQRQLVCLARALLRKTKILVLDEATASVDLETDSLIQRTIRQSFNDCTILTIAHRLNTIMDSDRILVLDDGHVAEFDTPDKLLANNDSIFYSMARSAGLLDNNN
ncbi:Mrp-4p [Dermatophagoides farinae]|uniref:Mrp-4p n=1 Tax=Dermatophagoides farinae TaxID=6954 RepID=A0A922I9G8_DERFA|nr:Mrp-4p [Dermatophagoides farinae]